MLRLVTGLTAASGYLRDCHIPQALKESLVKATFNRAVLLTEINDFVLEHHFGASAPHIKILSSIKRTITF